MINLVQVLVDKQERAPVARLLNFPLSQQKIRKEMHREPKDHIVLKTMHINLDQLHRAAMPTKVLGAQSN